MISLFLDVNVWIALSVSGHSHNVESWSWLSLLAPEVRLIFSRQTQLGLLRLLTNRSVMGLKTMTLKQAWDIYDGWLKDPRVHFVPEPNGIDAAFRESTAPFASQSAPQVVGDCYMLAFSRLIDAPLVTFDKALLAIGRVHGYATIAPN